MGTIFERQDKTRQDETAGLKMASLYGAIFDLIYW